MGSEEIAWHKYQISKKWRFKKIIIWIQFFHDRFVIFDLQAAKWLSAQDTVPGELNTVSETILSTK